MNTGIPASGYVARPRSGIEQQILSEKIVGLYVSNGIKRFDGDEESYLQVLRSFATDAIPLLDAVKYVKEENLADYTITVHGIKGSCRGICADMLADEAEALENAAMAGDFGFVSARHPAFLKAAWRLVADLSNMLHKIDAQKPKEEKEKPDKEMLTDLLVGCRKYDIDEIDSAMIRIENYKYKSDHGLTAWLRENVDHMNYKQIAEKLVMLIEVMQE